MVKGQNVPHYRFEAVRANDEENASLPLLKELVQSEFPAGAMGDIFRPQTNATIFACERHRKRGNKTAVLAVGFLAGKSAFVPFIANRSRRDEPHVEFFLGQLEATLFDQDGHNMDRLTIHPGNISGETFLIRGYSADNQPGEEAYRLTEQDYLARLALSKLQVEL